MRCWMGVCVFGMVAWETVGLGIRLVKDDGSGDGIRAGARRDENRERTGGGDKMGDGVIWERRWNLG